MLLPVPNFRRARLLIPTGPRLLSRWVRSAIVHGLMLVGIAACAAAAVVPAAALAPPVAVEPPATATDQAPALDEVQVFIEETVEAAEHLFVAIGCAAGDEVCEDVEMMRVLCIDGDAPQCRALATAYHLGEGVPRDWRKSGDAGAAGCLLGYGEACLMLANQMDLGGFGDDIDRQLSRRIYERECFEDDKWPWACFGLARWWGWYGGSRERALLALERGIEIDPTWTFLRETLDCMRANPDAKAFRCGKRP